MWARRWLVIVAVAGLATSGRGATRDLDIGPITAKLEWTTGPISIAEPVSLSLTMTAPPRALIREPKWVADPKHFLVLSTRMDGPDTVGRFHLRRWVCRIEPLTTGKLSMGSMELAYQDGKNPWRTESISLPTIEIVAAATIGDEELRPIPAPPAAPALPLARALQWGGITIALVIAIFALYRRRPRSSSRQEAMDRLRRFAERSMPSFPPRDAVATIIDIVRDYLVARYHLPADRKTTAELTAEQPLADLLGPVQREALREMFCEADVEKFSGRTLTESDARSCLEVARRFLEAEPE